MANTTATQLDQYKKIRRKRARVITMAAAVLFAIAILIGAVSYYGDHVGSFFIAVEKDSKAGLSLSETYEFENPRDVLMPEGLDKQTDTCYSYLPFDELNKSQGGVHSDFMFREYFAYTFFIKNASKAGQTVDYDIKMWVRTSAKNVDQAVRIMLIRNRDINNKNNTWIFAKADIDPASGDKITTDGKNITKDYKNDICCESQLFLGDKEICNIPIKAFMPQAIDTYTIIIWLEGDDPDCVDSIKRGAIMLDMEFTISNIIEP